MDRCITPFAMLSIAFSVLNSCSTETLTCAGQYSVQECWNCDYDWSGSCVDELDLAFVTPQTQIAREAACLQYLEEKASVVATVFRFDQEKCYFYDCVTGVTHNDQYKAFVKTCTAECLNATLSSYSGQKLTGDGLSHITGLPEAEECTLQLTTTSQSGAVSYSGNGDQDCFVTTACSTDCTMQSASGDFDSFVFACSGAATTSTTTTQTSNLLTTTLTTTSLTTTLASTSTTASTTTSTTPTATTTSSATTPTTSTTPTTITSPSSPSPESTNPSATTSTGETSTTSSTSSASATSSSTAQNVIMTTVLQTTKAKLYLMPCICYTGQEWTNLTQSEIIYILVKNITINTKKTSLAQSRYKCRPDSRVSSASIGSVAIAIMLAIIGFVVILDCGACKKIRLKNVKKRTKRNRKVTPSTSL